jgi:hypothetical protein
MFNDALSAWLKVAVVLLHHCYTISLRNYIFPMKVSYAGFFASHRRMRIENEVKRKSEPNEREISNYLIEDLRRIR